jgi:hypothetical protein
MRWPGHRLFISVRRGNYDKRRIARDISGLDFCAITDHDICVAYNSYLSLNEWKELQHINNEMNKNCKFITFLGYEYSRTNHTGFLLYGLIQ